MVLDLSRVYDVTFLDFIAAIVKEDISIIFILLVLIVLLIEHFFYSTCFFFSFKFNFENMVTVKLGI